MRRIFGAILVIFFGALSEAAFPYEVATHENLSEKALEASALGRPGILTGLGLKEILKDEKQQAFPNSKGTKQSINDLFRTGANFEDNLFLGTILRVRHHFYDPFYDRPLTVAGVAAGEKSPDWALEDQADIDGQEYSYKDARDYLYKALTLPTRTERDKHFGKTFQTLGQIIHHIQDMAQPQHVRNDVHPSIGAHKSLYEGYTDGHRGNLPFTGYPSVTFPTARQFWTDNGQGIAEFTNRNFVSAGTNFNQHHHGWRTV